MIVLKGLAIAANAALAAILSAMGVRIAAVVVEQYQSGWVPACMPLVFGLAIVSLVLAADVGAGIAVWLRHDHRRVALLADAGATLAVWSPFLLPLVFLPGGLLQLAWWLAPASTVLTSFVAWRDQPSAPA
jgi:hypothetical protein